MVGPAVVGPAVALAGTALAPSVTVEVTTVADDAAVLHDGARVVRHEGLRPDTDYRLEGTAVRIRTLPRPPGRRLATVATVNDAHFGETVCGLLEGVDLGPALSVGPGEPPYPETMNRAAAAEVASCRPDAVVAKGDLTAAGTAHQFAAFWDCYGTLFGDRLHWVRGNHDARPDPGFHAPATEEVALPGVVLALVDTSVPGQGGGDLQPDQVEWLDELAARADRPVLAFGHHPPAEVGRGGAGLSPDATRRLVDVVARRPALVGWFAGHTHRNLVRRMGGCGDVPFVEVASTKDFPAGWAEYRVFEGGILQVFRRTSAPEALDWSERTRAMFGGLYPSYSMGTIDDRCFPIWPRA
ncbi:MAG: metallophosphoesterase [Acidimicrobiales bacterium]